MSADQGWVRDWDEGVAAVGKDFSGGLELEAIDSIELGAIRRFCEPIEFDCPLHYERDVALRHGYRGVLAPLSGMVSAWTDRGLWRPGMPSRYPLAHPHVDIPVEQAKMPSPPFPEWKAFFATEIEAEYHEPPVVGDRLTQRGRKLLSCTARETRVGRGAFTTWERQVINQKGDLVSVGRVGLYYYVPHDEGAAPSPPTPASTAPEVEENLMEIRNVAPDPNEGAFDWSQQRYFEDVREGDDLEPVITNLTIARLVVEAGANRDFNQIHHNTPVSRATGAPDMYANNVFIQGWWERVARQFAGLDGRIKRIGPFRMNIFNAAGDAVKTSGSVKSKRIENGENLIEIEMKSESHRGVTVGPGSVLVSLPSRGD